MSLGRIQILTDHLFYIHSLYQTEKTCDKNHHGVKKIFHFTSVVFCFFTAVAGGDY